MKRHYITFILVFIVAQIFAQEPSSGVQGEITYEQIDKIEINLDGEASQFASMMPKERKSLKSLLFTSEESIYEKKNVSEDNVMDMDHGGMRVMIKMDEPENIIYTDLKNNEQIEQREFMTRKFLIESQTGSLKWKFTGNQKLILDYPCQEAILEGAEEKTLAWFTPAIPVPAGPGKLSGLPGIILALDINEGKKTIIATSVNLIPIENDRFVKPKKGKKVTAQEFEQIVDEKMKEMGVEEGKGGNRMMIRIHK